MAHDVATIIDEHSVVSCSLAEAKIHFSDPAVVAAWFGARYEADRTTVDVESTRIEFRHHSVQWRPDQLAVMVDGTVRGICYHAYVTLRGVIGGAVGGGVHEATEIWAHVELSSEAPGVASLIRTVLRRGLHHLSSELDVGPDNDVEWVI